MPKDCSATCRDSSADWKADNVTGSESIAESQVFIAEPEVLNAELQVFIAESKDDIVTVEAFSESDSCLFASVFVLQLK